MAPADHSQQNKFYGSILNKHGLAMVGPQFVISGGVNVFGGGGDGGELPHHIAFGGGGGEGSVATGLLRSECACILCIGGDGDHGLVALYVLRHLIAQLNAERANTGLPPVKPWEVFDVIGGGGEGGVVAIMLGRLRLDVDDCISAYDNLRRALFRAVPVELSSEAARGTVQDILTMYGGCGSGDEAFCSEAEDSSRVVVFEREKDSRALVRIRDYGMPGQPNASATICEVVLAILTGSLSGAVSAKVGMAESVGVCGRTLAEATKAEAMELWCSRNDELASLVNCFVTIAAKESLKRRADDDAPDLAALPDERTFSFELDRTLLQDGILAQEWLAAVQEVAKEYVEGHHIRVRQCALALKGKKRKTDPHFIERLRSAMKLPSATGIFLQPQVMGMEREHEVPRQTQVSDLPKRLITIPFDCDSDFVGREDILAKLDSAFSDRKRHRRAGIWGLGGIGKSQIAIEYAHRVMEREPNTSVFWAHASSVARFVDAYLEIGIKAGILERRDVTADITSTVSDWLSSNRSGRWLLIVDNLDDASILMAPTASDNALAESRPQKRSRTRPLASRIPQCKHGSVLVTSRFRKAAHSIVGDYQVLFQVDALSAVDAVHLLQTKLTLDEADMACADNFVHALEYIPLAITQAAAYVYERAPRMTLRRYLQEFSRSEVSRLTLLDQSAADLRRDPDVSSAVITTWAMSFQQILEQYPSAADLLSLMSVLDSESVPTFLLKPDGDDALLAFEDDLARLLGFAMISSRAQSDAFRVHPLVQLAMRSWLERNDRLSQQKRQAVKLLAERFSNSLSLYDWQACKQFFPHAEVAAAFEFEDEESLLQQAAILGSVANYMMKAGFGVFIEDQGERRLAIRTNMLSPHPCLLLRDLGWISWYHGEFAAAESLIRHALDGLHKAPGLGHSDKLMTINYLAAVLCIQGKKEAAKEMLRRDVFGSDHPRTQACINNLAVVLSCHGKSEAADEMYRRAVEKTKRDWGLTILTH